MVAFDLEAPDTKSVAQLERLIEIGRSLNSTLELRPLLQRIAVAAQQLTDTEETSILLLDRRSGQLHFEAATNLPGVRSIVVPMEGSIAGLVVQTSEPVVVPDARQDPRFYRRADEQSDFSTRSIVAVPMVVRDNVIGVLEAVNKRGGEAFTQEDIEMLTVLGGQAAVAVQNALLFQQSDLVAEIVHEMRTPLMSVIGYAELMQQPGVTLEQCQQFAGIVEGEAERLTGLANSFLDLAKLESGRAALDYAPVDLSTVIRMAVSVLRPQASAKQVGLSVNIVDDLPPVVGDGQRLHQVMLNLIGNGIKYCRSGDRVVVAARRKEDALVVSVADTGPGIPAEALPLIFERFYRVPGSEDEAVGSGLGLTITRKIVEAHGGEISVSSEEGQGATFTFTLPLEGAASGKADCQSALHFRR
jgi:signal transduction histidine kinase